MLVWGSWLLDTDRKVDRRLVLASEQEELPSSPLLLLLVFMVDKADDQDMIGCHQVFLVTFSKCIMQNIEIFFQCCR